MEPLHPELRKALKRAHPGLTDEEIDQYEGLLARRFELDPETEAAEIQKIDAKREELMRQAMPRYEAVVRAFSQREARGKRRPPPKIKVKKTSGKGQLKK